MHTTSILAVLLSFLTVCLSNEDLPLGTKRLYVPLIHALSEGQSVIKHQSDHEHEASKDKFCDTMNQKQQTSKCLAKTQYVAIISRHGARMPTEKKKQPLLSFARRVCALETGEELTEQQKWCQWALDFVEPLPEGSVTEYGLKEMRDMGVWFADTYLNSLSEQEITEVLSSMTSLRTSKLRTIQSCHSFYEGVQASIGPLFSFDQLCNTEADTLLKPYKRCNKLQIARAKLKKSLKIPESSQTEAKNRISQRTGLNTSEILGMADLEAAYVACQVEVAVGGLRQLDKSWACGLLGPYLQNLSMIEHVENFELRGFGQSVGREVMVDLFKHITNTMQSVATSEVCSDKPLVELFFTHDSVVLPMVALLDLLDLGNNPYTAYAAKYCPFASRIVIEVLSCGSIFISYNEKTLRIFEDGIVGWQSFYRDILAKDLIQICDEQANPQNTFTIGEDSEAVS